MNLLVTGGAGFIGSHLVEALLRRGHSVTVVDNFNDYYPPAVKRRNVAAFGGGATVCECDIRDAPKLAQIFAARHWDGIYHLAACAGVRPSLQQPALYADVNILGTQRLLELAHQHAVRKFIFASSSSVYGSNATVPFQEDQPVNRPLSPYAATKLAGEALTHVYHHLYGLDVACLRFFTVYGPRQRPDLAIHKFTRAILHDQPIEVYGDGESSRDYTYIDDILQGLLACLDRSFGYEIINLGGSRPVKLRELVRRIERATGKTARITALPAQPGDMEHTCADIARAGRLLGYTPQVAIEDGLPKFVEWYRREWDS
jgi:UDP-glucuronate 4-epimerase